MQEKIEAASAPVVTGVELTPAQVSKDTPSITPAPTKPSTLQTEVPLGSDDEHHEPKRGHLCCGCLCDMRRAVIAVNAIEIFFTLVLIGLTIAAIAVYEDQIQTINVGNYDESFWFSVYGLPSKLMLGIVIGLGVVSIFFLSLGIHGARKYNQCMVATTMIFHSVSFVCGIIALDWITAVVAALFVYPHVMLLREIRQGIMTEETYPRERKTCCGP